MSEKYDKNRDEIGAALMRGYLNFAPCVHLLDANDFDLLVDCVEWVYKDKGGDWDRVEETLVEAISDLNAENMKLWLRDMVYPVSRMSRKRMSSQPKQ